MTRNPAAKRPDFDSLLPIDRLNEEPGFDPLDPLDDCAAPDFEDIVGTALRVAAGESFD